MTPLLEVRDLSTHFLTPAGRVRALDGVSFTLEAGRCLGVVGETGSGKTVLARSIMGLLPQRGVERRGEVWFAGRDLAACSPRDLRAVWGREIGIVFQDPMTSLNPVMTVGRQVAEPLRVHLRLSRAEAERAALALLREVGVPEPKRRFAEYPHQLSGGLRQRVMIAIALACSPRLLIADEPTTALDVTVQAQILTLLEEERARRGMAMILVTHDLAVAAGRTDEIAVMYAGQVVERAPTRELFRRPRMPYTEALLASIPRLDAGGRARLRAIGGRPPDPTALPTGCRFHPRCPYAQPRCLEEAPPLREEPPGHRFACWYPPGTPEGRAALERNDRLRATGASRREEDTTLTLTPPVSPQSTGAA